MRECQERPATAASIAHPLRPFETALFVAGFYSMPPEFNAHVADTRVSMHTVVVRRMAKAMFPFRAGACHSKFSEGSQWALILSISELSVLASLQIPLQKVHWISALPGSRGRTEDMYGYDQAWHLEREFTGHDARLAMASSSTPSVYGTQVHPSQGGAQIPGPHDGVGVRASRVHQCPAPRSHRLPRCRGPAPHKACECHQVGNSLR